MPTGDTYARAVYAARNPYIRKEITQAREDLGLPPEGVGTKAAAQEWYKDHGGENPEAIGKSPPGAVPNLRPLAQQLANLTEEGLSPDAEVDRLARDITTRYGLPASMVGWLREEILRDSSHDATPPDGRIDYVETFHRSTESIRTLVNEMPGRGEDVDGVYVHAAPLHVGVQRSATRPPAFCWCQRR